MGIDELLQKLQGSEEAKARMRALLLAYVEGEPVDEVCQALDVGRSRFFELQKDGFQGMLSALEPKPPGRPGEEQTEKDRRIAELEDENKELRIDKEAALVRASIAAVFPKVLEKKSAPGGPASSSAPTPERAPADATPAREPSRPVTQKEIAAEVEREEKAMGEEMQKELEEIERSPAVIPSRFHRQDLRARAMAAVREHNNWRRRPRRSKHGDRNSFYQHEILGIEREARFQAVSFVHWVAHFALSVEDAAFRIGMSASTLRKWCQAWTAERLAAAARGRPYDVVDYWTRAAVKGVMADVGPGISFLALQKIFPAIPREALLDMHWRYRNAFRHGAVEAQSLLHWHRVGAVWAMDFHDVKAPIDGKFPHVLVVKDLASRAILEAMPVLREDHETVIAVLTYLFAAYGPPLVIKSDNGPGFKAKETADFLRRYGVLQLLSPPYTPAYNGAAEAAVGTIKTWSFHVAMRNGRPSHWTSDDVEEARLIANDNAFPFGEGGPTARDLLEHREPLSEKERAHLLEHYADCEREARIERDIPKILGQDPEVQADIDREAITRALKTLGFLEIERRGNSPPIKSRKLAGIPQ